MARPDAKTYIDLYNDAKQLRVPREADWRLAAAYCNPKQYNAWNSTGPSTNIGSMAAARRIAYDSTAMRALPKFQAVCERILTPHNMRYQALSVSDRNLASNIHVRTFFDTLNDKLFAKRYEAKALFIQSSAEMYGSIGTYGTGPVYLGNRKPSPTNKRGGFLYRSCALRDVYILIDDDGSVSHVFRRFWLNCRQFKQKFPGAPVPKCFAAQDASGKMQEASFFEFVHVVCERADYDPSSLFVNRHAFTGSYISVTDATYVGDEQGFVSQPYLTPRIGTEAGDPYGYGVASQAIPAMGTASQIKKTVIKQGQKAVDPVLLTHDDGIMNGSVDLRPGAQNPGAVDKQGRLLVHALPTGDFKVSDQLLTDERDDINDAFLVKLFQMLMQEGEKTAEEVLQFIADRAMMVAPLMGRVQSEFLSPATEREIDLLVESGEMPPYPPELVEAKGGYDIIYTSPMAKGMYADEVQGFMRAVNFAEQLAQGTGDPSYMDNFNFDTAIPEMAEMQATPARWMATPAQKASKGDARSKMQQQQQLLQNAGNISAAAKNVQAMQGAQGAQIPPPMQGGVPAAQPPMMPALPGMPNGQ